MVGATLSHYKILEKLGEGGMGIVYRAEDLKLRRNVAIKVFPSIVAASPDDRLRFFQEARLASALNHPNIVTIHEFDEHEGTAFIVSECVEGKSLSAVLQEGPLVSDRLYNIAIQIAAGITEAHSHGIIHRDIKSDNVMISHQGQAKVMDFGLARLMGSSHVTTPGSLIGTFAYMSPEQINEDEVDAQSDIFSFGTLLYQMATGELPFKGKTVAELLSSIARKNPDSPGNLRSDLSPELDRIIMKALQKERARRYHSMHDLMSDLELLRANPSMKRKFDGWNVSRRSLMLSVIVAGLGVALVAYFLRSQLGLTKQGHPEKSIAVLPFQSIGGDSSTNFLKLGFADEIITRLTYIRSLLVKPTSAVAVYEDRLVDASEVGKAVGVDAVLQGRFQKVGDRLFITTQLIDVPSRNIIRADKFDFHWDRLGLTQTDVAERVVDALQLQITAAERLEIRRAKTSSAEGYEYYLRGIEYLHKSSRENNLRAIRMLEQAIARDSLFAQALSHLSEAYVEQFWSNYSSDTMWIQRGLESARRAIQLDPGLADAHTNYGFALRIKGRYAEGVAESFRALEIDPRSSSSLEIAGSFYQHLGDFTKARILFERASEYNPSFNINRVLARMLQFQGKYRESIYELQRAIQRSPDDAWLRGGLLAQCYVRLEEFEKAEEAIRRAAMSEPTSPQIGLSRAMLETARGNYDRAGVYLKEIGAYTHADYAMAGRVASIYAKQGKQEMALDWISRAAKLGNYWHSWYQNDSWFDGLRSHPRFVSMMTDMKTTLDEVAVTAPDLGL